MNTHCGEKVLGDFLECESFCCVGLELFLMGRAPCCDKKGLKKGPWTPEEDEKLVEYINNHGHGSWRSLPKLAGFVSISCFK